MSMLSSNSFINPTGTVEAFISKNGHFSIKENRDLGGFYGAYRHQNLVQH